MDIKAPYTLPKADYTKKEKEVMSPYRKRISRMTGEEWCAEWDRVTSAICINYGLKRKR